MPFTFLFDLLNGCSTYNVSLSGPVVWTVYLFLMSLKELENSFLFETTLLDQKFTNILRENFSYLGNLYLAIF